MAMTILNNTSAMMTLGELNKNVSRVGKDLKKLSSGMKINSAGDDASAYAISERMQVMMRSLDQDEQNVKNGRFLLNVAAGGIDNIVQELRSLKELALNSANDHNTDADRATIQKEFDQRMANIDDIAAETNYNGKILLDGRYGRKRVNADSGSSADVTDVTDVAGTTKMEPSGSVTLIPSGNYTIADDGVYMLDSGYTGTIQISSSAKNVKIQQSDPSVALNNVFIEGPSSGGANLWIEELNIANTIDRNIIQFNGTDNFLTIKSTNNLQTSGENTSALIHVGNGLTVEGTETGELYLRLNSDSAETGAGIGTNSNENNLADVTINSGKIGINMVGTAQTVDGAGIGSGTHGSIGNIYINGAQVDLLTGLGAGVGSGGFGTVGNIEIDNNALVVSRSVRWGTGIGSGILGTFGDITVKAATIDVYAYGGAGIGSGFRGNGGDITIYGGATITARAEGGAGIGSGERNATVGDIALSRQASITAQSLDSSANGDGYIGEDIGAGYQSTAGDVTYFDDEDYLDDEDGNGLGLYIPKPLVIHHGPKSNQALNVYINDMRTDAMGLTGTAVTTRDKATKAIETIDLAVDYALDEATNVGAYISRLEYTEENIVTANENTQASESTIRDADMAKEMMSYTKNNVLAQASQSMLAQANQNASSVLSLLQ